MKGSAHGTVLLVTAVLGISGAGCGGSGTGTAAESTSGVTLPAVTAPEAPEAPSIRAQRGALPTSTGTPEPSAPPSPVVTYKRAYNDLPFHRPPLYITQIVSFGRPGPSLDARVGERRFLCEMTPAERRVAVRSYYELALARVKAEGQSELRLRVSRFELTGYIKHVYAIAQDGRVTLTAEGSGGCPE